MSVYRARVYMKFAGPELYDIQRAWFKKATTVECLYLGTRMLITYPQAPTTEDAIYLAMETAKRIKEAGNL